MLIKRSLMFLLFSLSCFSLVIGSVLYVFLTAETEEIIEAIAKDSEKIIIIDAGHGGEDCGAIGKNGVFEKDLNLQIANTLGEYLSKSGYTVVYTRTEDKLLYKEEENIKGFRKINDLKNRVKISEQYENAIFISIHMNSFAQEKYSGLQVYYSSNSSKSKEIAASIQKEVKDRLQPENKRNIKEGDDLYVLSKNNNTAVLIECGFISNNIECQKLCEKEYQKELCFAICCGILNIN